MAYSGKLLIATMTPTLIMKRREMMNERSAKLKKMSDREHETRREASLTKVLRQDNHTADVQCQSNYLGQYHVYMPTAGRPVSKSPALTTA